MLGKLIKHEFKDTMRLFLPIYLLIAILTPVFALLIRFGYNDLSNMNSEQATQLSMTFQVGLVSYYLLLVGLFIGSQIMIALRFYRTISTNEAYLTFTLPTTSGKILFSKWLIAFIYYVASCIITIGSVFITVLIAIPDSWDAIVDIFQRLPGLLGADINILSLALLFGVMLLISGICSILQIYVSIVLGQLFRSHRVIISIGFYIALTVVLEIIETIFILPSIIVNATSGSFSIYTFLLSLLLMYVVIACALYATTYFIMKKHVNIR